MTEDEAKQKWCPMARTYTYLEGETPIVINRYDGPMGDSYCLGSQCMMWKKDKMREFQEEGTDVWVFGGSCGLAK